VTATEALQRVMGPTEHVSESGVAARDAVGKWADYCSDGITPDESSPVNLRLFARWCNAAANMMEKENA
jgi:hypothetical protein